MPSYYPCRLRRYRKSAALSQRKLASLLGLASQSIVSHYETQTRSPSLRALIACELIFGVPGRDLFPALFAQAEHDLKLRAEKVASRIAGARSPAQTREFFEALIERLGTMYEPS